MMTSFYQKTENKPWEQGWGTWGIISKTNLETSPPRLSQITSRNEERYTINEICKPIFYSFSKKINIAKNTVG